MKLTILKDSKHHGRTFKAGESVLISGQLAVDMLNAGDAVCDDGRCGKCPPGQDGETACTEKPAERATKKRTNFKLSTKTKPAGDE